MLSSMKQGADTIVKLLEQDLTDPKALTSIQEQELKRLIIQQALDKRIGNRFVVKGG